MLFCYPLGSVCFLLPYIGLVTSMVSVALTTLFSTSPATILTWHGNDVDKIGFARSETTGSMVWRGLARFRF